MWQHEGARIEGHMPTGEAWYLDTRKPHQALNKGVAHRVHLVLDVEACPELRAVLGDDAPKVNAPEIKALDLPSVPTLSPEPMPAQQEAPAPDTVRVKVSAKMARLKFNGCDPDYIRDVCHASCCQSSTHPTGTLITVHPTETAAMEARGATVLDGMLQPNPGEKKCPFKTGEHLCGLHFTPDKPFGCIASPFTLNKNGTLIVRNRYTKLKCYKDGNQIPAYKAFRASLDLIFGAEEAARICDHLDNGGGDLFAHMARDVHDKLVTNDQLKKQRQARESDAIGLPTWITGDSKEIETLTPGLKADFLFSCPPYADLEVYSDDPRDISNMDYPAFKATYRAIIAAACAKLKDDRFACFVVGEVRDKAGAYYNFLGDTIDAFRDAGLHYYNEIILVNSAGSLPLRAGRGFNAGRKIGKTHQNVLVFYKGNMKNISATFGPVDVTVTDDGDAENGEG